MCRACLTIGTMPVAVMSGAALNTKLGVCEVPARGADANSQINPPSVRTGIDLP